MEIALVALGTLLALAVVVITVLLHERAHCKRAHRRKTDVATVLVVGGPELEREAVRQARDSFHTRPIEGDETPSTLRSGK